MSKNFGYFHILASAMSLSVKISIWQAHWLDLVGINLCAKNYRKFHKISRIEVFRCHILTAALPRLRKTMHFYNSSVWILSIWMYIQKFINMSHMVEDLRRFSHFFKFFFFCYSIALVKWHLASVLAKSFSVSVSIVNKKLPTTIVWRADNAVEN